MAGWPPLALDAAGIGAPAAPPVPAAGQGRGPALLDDAAGDALGEALVAEVAQQPSDLALREVTQEVSGGGAVRGGVHPHVQRRIDRVGEAAIGGVDLEAGQPKVHHHSVGAGQPELFEHLGDLVVGGVDQGGPPRHSGAVQAFPGELEGLRIAIDADEVSVGRRLEHGCGMAAHAERRVHVDRARLLQRRSEELDGSVEEDRARAAALPAGRCASGPCHPPGSVS